MHYRQLGSTELQVSEIGFGGAAFGGLYGDVTVESSRSTVSTAIDAGINFFDTSPFYGETRAEELLGKALVGRRHEIVLATKAGRYGRHPSTGFDFSPKRIRLSLEESLKRLNTDYIDLFQLHDIEFRGTREIVDNAMPTMHQLKQEGKARFIGITGYPMNLLQEIAEQTRPDTILSYCHYNLMNTTLAVSLLPFAQKTGIGIINGSVLHMGILTPQGTHDLHPAPKAVKEVGQRVAAYCAQQGESIVNIALQFALQKKEIASTLVGMRTPSEVVQNVNAFRQSLDEELLYNIQNMIAPVKDVNWIVGLPENADAGSAPAFS